MTTPLPLLLGSLVGPLALALAASSTTSSTISSAPSPATPSRVVAAGRAAPEAATGVWPLDPRPEVVHPFAPPVEVWEAGHRGVDLAGSVGRQVRSALAGRVAFVGRIAGRGVVVVDHGRTRTTYEPVRGSVRVGDPVSAGAGIGRLEWFGSHCLPAACLHWGWRQGDTYLDPLGLVGDGPRPVRLLPLGGSPAT